MSLRKVIASGGKVTPPSWLPDNLCFETQMGSTAYNVSTDSSDVDVHGICLPPKTTLFPHLAGEIYGFGTQIQRFNTWQEHRVESDGKIWDFQIYNIVTFFQLAMDNNPNVLDVIFTPRRCILSSTQVGEYIREHRRDFLHKGAWHKFRGYAWSQLSKVRTKEPKGKRAELVEKYGFDVKFALHTVRLLLEGEQILVEHDLDLERHAELLRAIRRGEWTQEQLETWAAEKEKQLEAVYQESALRYSPDEPLVRRHLMHCLEAHYGNLSAVVASPEADTQLLRQIAKLTERYR